MKDNNRALEMLNEMYAVLNDSNRWHKHKLAILEALQPKEVSKDVEEDLERFIEDRKIHINSCREDAQKHLLKLLKIDEQTIRNYINQQPNVEVDTPKLIIPLYNYWGVNNKYECPTCHKVIQNIGKRCNHCNQLLTAHSSALSNVENKTAKEMFEELGYELELNEPYYGAIKENAKQVLCYSHKPYDERKNIVLFELYSGRYRTYGISGTPLQITKELHQAITQQLKELEE